jgi:DNA-binding MarR family transcriptional regulator
VDDRERLVREAWTTLLSLFLGDEARGHVHDAVAAAGLPHPGALKALLLLDAADPPSMRSLAEQLQCDASYITNLIGALEAQGYVERRTSAHDRRVKLVHLTPDGERARDHARHVIEQPPRAFDRLTDAQIRTLAHLTTRLGR